MNETCVRDSDWMILTKETEVLRGKNLFPVPLYPPQIPHGLPCDWNRSFTARGRHLTTWVVTLLDELSLAVKQIKQSHIDTSWVSRQPWGSFEFHPTPDKPMEFICRPFLYAMRNFISYPNSIWHLLYRSNLGPFGVFVAYWRHIRFKSRMGFPMFRCVCLFSKSFLFKLQ
jgi:hypothetical protein